MIAWSDYYSTRFPEIDDQHKRLFQVFNQFEKDIEQGKGKDRLEEILDFLEEYIQMHFGYEEECMHKHKCLAYQKNKMAHKKFIEGYHTYRDRYQEQGATKKLVKDIHKECEFWIINHICKVDIHLRECAQKEVLVK